MDGCTGLPTVARRDVGSEFGCTSISAVRWSAYQGPVVPVNSVGRLRVRFSPRVDRGDSQAYSYPWYERVFGRVGG